MFTGLVQSTGVLESLTPTPAGRRLIVRCPGWDHRPAPGDSIAVSGCCLTVAEPPRASPGGTALAFDVVPETLDKTTLGALTPGDAVNLEHAVTASTLMGGHFVQGHVDGVGRVDRAETSGQWRIRIAPPPALMPYMVPKGSVCVDGVSLTIADVRPAECWFEVALIPTTLERTTLRALRPSGAVNIEADVLVKAVVHALRHYPLGQPAT
ncbi:MAG: riboflavin synthase [Phycisphaerae bacterium]|nr:riboflavin synthase [Phycisphaerae bacterium]